MGYSWKRKQEKRLKRLEQGQERVLSLLWSIRAMGEQQMAISQDIKDLLKKIDAATNDVAARIQKLSDQLAGGVTPEAALEIQAGLQAEVDRLTAMATDPANPVPTP